MFKKLAQRSALVVALTVLVAPVSRSFAQSAPPPVVTGGDPQPIGESQVSMLYLLSMVLSLGLS